VREGGLRGWRGGCLRACGRQTGGARARWMILRRRIAEQTFGGTAAESSGTSVLGSGPTRVPQARRQGLARGRPAMGAGPLPRRESRPPARPPRWGSRAAVPTAQLLRARRCHPRPVAYTGRCLWPQSRNPARPVVDPSRHRPRLPHAGGGAGAAGHGDAAEAVDCAGSAMPGFQVRWRVGRWDRSRRACVGAARASDRRREPGRAGAAEAEPTCVRSRPGAEARPRRTSAVRAGPARSEGTRGRPARRRQQQPDWMPSAGRPWLRGAPVSGP
jgi:hypothetical protein